MNRLLLVLSLAALTGCGSVVRATSLRPDYDQTDKTQTTRLVLIVQPHPGGNAKVAELWARMARRYVHLKRQYIIKAHTTSEQPPSAFVAQGVCTSAAENLGEGEKVEGVLWIEPTVLKGDDEGLAFDAGAKLRLLRCADGAEVWSAEGQGHWSAGSQRTLRQSWDYAAELGSEVGPYVAPTWELLRPLLDTLPDVVLDEAGQEEKVLAE